MTTGIPHFTVESLQTSEGISELNRIIQQLSDNSAGDTDTVRIYNGFGTPESNISAGIGSLFQRLDGGSGTTLYVKESGTGDTGWIAIVTDTSVSTDKLIKAWISIDGTGTIAIRNSFNVSSIVDTAVGRVTVNWDTDFADDTYAVGGVSGTGSGNVYFSTNPTASSVLFGTNNNSGTAIDQDYVTVIATGDQ